ncbi:probable pectinesterase/pectinesterase inhibitor 6 [Hibiscus syriacus]|uniref:probable pectinesterase/pectinesterase inhibitor 6 n=1 Tax=Hibiscus syriacus TaxID=106335 RepID=UPI001920DC0C|nr:probable pectinesterase/pectinesterase inhibitor 6 [Hibiscus syriacus]
MGVECNEERVGVESLAMDARSGSLLEDDGSLAFVKKSSLRQTIESMDVFQTVPQNLWLKTERDGQLVSCLWSLASGNRSHDDGLRTIKTATVEINGDGFVASGDTFQNVAGPEKKQAVALLTKANYVAFYKSVFQRCNIFARKPLEGQSNTVTAEGRNVSTTPGGFVIQNCMIRATSELIASEYPVETYLGVSILEDGWSMITEARAYAEYDNRVLKFINGDTWIPPTGAPYNPNLDDDAWIPVTVSPYDANIIN